MRRKLCRLKVADPTNKLYQSGCVANQGKKRGQNDHRKEPGFAQKIVTRFVFEITATDYPRATALRPAHGYCSNFPVQQNDNCNPSSTSGDFCGALMMLVS